LYTGNNKTALTSQQQIAEAFVLLLKDVPYSSISVSAICKKAGISRQTFYTLFSSRENIVLYLLDKNHGFTPGCSCKEAFLSLQELSREYSSYIADRKEFLSLLVKNDLIYLMHECLFQSFMSCPMFLPDLPLTRREFGAEFISGGLAGIARIYAETPDASRTELEQTITSLLSGSFFR